MAPKPKLAIIAGGGDLPRLLIAACRDEGRPFFVIALQGHADPATVTPDLPHLWVRLGAGGTILKTLKEQACPEIVMAGRVKRPSLLSLSLLLWLTISLLLLLTI